MTCSVFTTNLVTAGQAVKVSYDPSQAGGDNKKLRDTDGNEVASFTEFEVTNVVGDGTVPTVASAAVDGTALTLTFNELMNFGSHSPAGSAFTATATPSGGGTDHDHRRHGHRLHLRQDRHGDPGLGGGGRRHGDPGLREAGVG